MNKKIVVLIVIVECILAVLLIGVIGLAIESTYKEVGCREIYFTTPEGEKLDSDAILEVARPDKGYQLHYAMDPANTSDKSVTFTSGKPEFVTVNAPTKRLAFQKPFFGRSPRPRKNRLKTRRLRLR